VPVAESVLAPPGPIPNPVVTQRSAGEYCGGDPMGGEAAAGTPHPPSGATASLWHDGQPVARVSRGECVPLRAGGSERTATTAEPHTRRGVEQRQLVGLITQRSGVRIPPPLPHRHKRPSKNARSLFCWSGHLLVSLSKKSELLHGLLTACCGHVGAYGDRWEECLKLGSALEEVAKPLGNVAQPPKQVGCVLIVGPFFD
jgi:hypothetical protein